MECANILYCINPAQNSHLRRNNGYVLYASWISPVFVTMGAWEFQDQISSVRKQTKPKKMKIRENKI